jgi:hypothetical protein
MAMYITLLSYTQQGIRNLKESPARLDAAKGLCQLKRKYPSQARRRSLPISNPNGSRRRTRQSSDGSGPRSRRRSL